MLRATAVRAWQRDRAALAVLALGCAVATIGWRATTRPMGDTPTYRAAAVVITGGWDQLTDRTPLYPLLLWATGAARGSSPVLFGVQLLLHVSTVVMVLDLAGRAGVGRRGRIALAALLVAPPVMLRVLHEGTEGLSAWLLTAVAWLLVTAGRDLRVRTAVGLGALCAAAALTRPTFVLLWVPVALLAARSRTASGPEPRVVAASGPDPHRARRGRLVAVIALPSVVAISALSAYNGARFDSFGPTPLAPYHLSSRTSAYVEDLPARYEPARSVLVAERDRALLEGEESAPANYIWDARDDLERATGKSGPELDRYVMEMDLHLIVRHPFDYGDAVLAATLDSSEMDSQPAILGVGRPVVWGLSVVHLLLLAVFVAAVSCLPGLALAGRLPSASARPAAVAAVLSAYVVAVSVLTESGTARLRSPTEPLLALLLVLALGAVAAARADRVSRASAPGAASAG